MMDIYDYVSADTLGHEPNEQIFFNNDYVEVKKTYQEGDTVVVQGFSHVSGDSVTYLLTFDEEVGLWAV